MNKRCIVAVLDNAETDGKFSMQERTLDRNAL